MGFNSGFKGLKTEEWSKQFCETWLNDSRIKMQGSKHVAQRAPKSILSLPRRTED